MKEPISPLSLYEGCRREYSHAGVAVKERTRPMGKGCRKADLFLVPEMVAIKHKMGSLVSKMTSQAYCSRATTWKVG